MPLPTGKEGEAVQVLVEALAKAQTDLIKIAAQCVRGDGLPSPIQEDWEVKVPVKVLNAIFDLHDNQRKRGINARMSADNIKQALQQAEQLMGGDDAAHT